MLTSAVQKYLTLFVNIRISFSCFILFKCAWGADCCKQKIIFERIFIDKNMMENFLYKQKVPATEELDSTNFIEDALVIIIS